MDDREVLQRRLELIRERLKKAKDPEEVRGLGGERDTLLRELEVWEIVARNQEAARRAQHDAAERAERLTALRTQRDKPGAELADVEEQQRALVTAAAAERPDLPPALIWETPADWTYRRRREELLESIVAIDHELQSLPTLEKEKATNVRV